MLSSADNPFVGLRPFESDESLLFFGRQEQTLELLQRLHQYHFVAVTGSSGSGKSSLIKAGLIPRLKAGYLVDDSDKWVISSMKPGESPLYNLANSLITQPAFANTSYSAQSLKEKIEEEGVEIVLDILEPLWENNTNYFLLVDQFEELFRFSMHQSDIAKKDEAIDFVNILLQLSKQLLPVYIVITMRSDFIGDCADFYGLPEALNQSQYVVPRLNRVQLETTIEGPVTLYDGKINPALTARLLNDAQIIKDELPLLQHSLMRIWDTEKDTDKNGELDLEDYKRIGGIEKALSNHADEALEGMDETQLKLTKKIFQALTGVDENGRKIRKPVRLTYLQALTGVDREMLLGLINLFIEDKRNFLIISKTEDDDLVIDISHESLIRQWGKLNTWVDEEAAARKILLRLSESVEWSEKTSKNLIESAKQYEENKKDLLTGNELQSALDWFNSFKPDTIWAGRYGANYEKTIQFLKASERQRNFLQRQKAKEQLIKLRNRRLLIASLILIILVISSFSFFIYKNYLNNKKQLALNYWKSSYEARSKNNYLDALHLIAEAAEVNPAKDLTNDLLIDGEAFLPHVFLSNIFTQNTAVTNVSFSPDGKLILCVTSDGTVSVLDKQTGKPLKIFKHTWAINTAVFNKDGSKILTAGNDSAATIYDVLSGDKLLSLKHEDDVTTAAFSPDENRVLTGSSDGNVQIWNLQTNTVTDSAYYPADISNAVFNPDGSKVIFTCGDTIPHIWNVTAKKQIPFTTHSDNEDIVTGAVFNSDGSKVLTINFDSSVSIWNISGIKLATLKHNDRVTDAVFSPDDKYILTACRDKSACLWDIETYQQIPTAMKHDGPVYSIAFSIDRKQLLTAGYDKTIRLWNIETSKTKNATSPFIYHGITTIGAFNPNEKNILTVGFDSVVRLWDAESRKQIDSLKHRRSINSAMFNNDGTLILTSCDDSTVRLWNVLNGKLTDSIRINERINYAAFNLKANKILTTSYDNYVRIWNILNQKMQLADSFRQEAILNSAVFSNDDKTILIAGEDSSAYIIDAASGKKVKLFKHDFRVKSAVFSRLGNTILSASGDKAYIWDVKTGKQIGPALKHSAEINSAVFSPDGKRILTAGWDMLSHLWNTTTFKELGFPKNNGASVTSASFSPDGKHILTTSYNSTINIWEIEGDLDMPPSLFKLQAKVSTGVEYDSETGETRCIPIESWLALKEEYQNQAREHYKTCKYPQYNLWQRFNKEDAGKISSEHSSK